MVRFTTLFVSALSLLALARAATTEAPGCFYSCPPPQAVGIKARLEGRIDEDITFLCSYDLGLSLLELYNCHYYYVGHISLSNFQL